MSNLEKIDTSNFDALVSDFRKISGTYPASMLDPLETTFGFTVEDEMLEMIRLEAIKKFAGKILYLETEFSLAMNDPESILNCDIGSMGDCFSIGKFSCVGATFDFSRAAKRASSPLAESSLISPGLVIKTTPENDELIPEEPLGILVTVPYNVVMPGSLYNIYEVSPFLQASDYQ